MCRAHHILLTMFRIVDIPRDRWPSFVDMINRLADGRPVRVEVARRDLGDQDVGVRVPLVEISLDTKGSGRGTFTVTVGDDAGGELTHIIDAPARMSIGVNDAGEPQWLGIEQLGEGATIVYFEELPALASDFTPAP
jgi:hypothetical protein